MIVVDIETTGLDPIENAILSVGAIYFENPKNYFYGECRINKEDKVSEQALIINGFTREDITDTKKQTEKELVERFYKWVDSQQIRMFGGHNVGSFDLNFLKTKSKKYGIKIKGGYRSMDLCTTAQDRYYDIHGGFLLDDYNENAMSLDRVLDFCGILDERLKVDPPKKTIVKHGKTHNALEDAKLEAECFSRLLDGKNLFPEYAKFKIPKYLQK